MKINNRTFALSFDGDKEVKENYSQAGQDIFVLSCLNGKKNGTFLDLGCNHPLNGNNTFLLENKFLWKGVSIDIDEKMISLWKEQRTTLVLNKDCRNLNFDEIISALNTNHIDYLSMDLEPADATLYSLSTIPFDKVEFSLITYEHDLWRFGEYCMKESRKIMEKYGYKRICTNVGDPCPVTKSQNPFEDWYYNPKYVSYERIKVLKSYSEDWKKFLFRE